MPFAAWVNIGQELSAIADSSAWCLGDWLIYGEKVYIDRYKSAVERTSLDYQTLRNYAWVARRFAIPRRHPNLSFAHHAEVAARPEAEQNFWLRKADEFHWSRNRLREELKTSLREREAAESGSGGTETHQEPGAIPEPPEQVTLREPDHALHLQLTPEQLVLCRRAANAHQDNLHDWAVSELEQAALRGASKN